MLTVSTNRQRGRVVKAVDSKSTGFRPHRFKSCRCRKFLFLISMRERIFVSRNKLYLVIEDFGIMPNHKISILFEQFSDPCHYFMSSFEDEHVQKVYEAIASHFSSTRFKRWPVVDKFISSLSAGSFGCDFGCGNGKNLEWNTAKLVTLGMDA